MALCGLLGTALQLQQAALLPRAWAGPAALGAGLLLSLWAAGCLHRPAPARGGGRGALAGLALGGLALGLGAMAFGQAEWRARHRLADRLAPRWEGVDLLVQGRVLDMPQLSPHGLRFVFQPTEVSAAAPSPALQLSLPARLSLSWSRGWQEDALLAGPPPDLQAGDCWQLPLRLRQPHAVLNPHGFDAELWLFEQGVGAVGTVRAGARHEPRRLAAGTPGCPGAGPAVWIEARRQAWRDAVLLRVADPDAAGVLAALSVGDQAALSGPQWELFRQTGVAHLMSISGLHITLLAAVAGALVRRLWACSSRACARWPAPTAARWAAIIAALLYAGLAGWGIPAQRTVAMLTCLALLRGAGWRWPAPVALVVSATLVIGLDPWALLQPGFWLSFGAVAVLMLAEPAPPLPAGSPWPQRLRRWGVEAVRAQVRASLALAPLGLLLFQQVSVLGLAANLIAVPWVTAVVTPLALLGMLLPPAWDLAAWTLRPLLNLLSSLAAWAGPGWVVPAASPLAVGLGLLGLTVAVVPGPWRRRLWGLPMVLPMLWPPVARPAWGQFDLLAADVGQGSAVLVRTARHLLVHDAGPQWSPDSDAGQRILLPLLRARGDTRIDELQVSHRDLDHAGGAAALLAGLPVGRLRSSLAPGHPLLALGVPAMACRAGQRWQWDGVDFEILHPDAATASDPTTPPNGLSCVLQVRAADGHRALLTGDIEAAQELALVRRWGRTLASDILMVPHHGSKTSSTPEFLAAVQPKVAVIQVAYRSRYGHPHAEVLNRYGALPPLSRPLVVRTDQCGAWFWQFDGAWCTRDVRRRYWHWPALGENPKDGVDVATVTGR